MLPHKQFQPVGTENYLKLERTPLLIRIRPSCAASSSVTVATVVLRFFPLSKTVSPLASPNSNIFCPFMNTIAWSSVDASSTSKALGELWRWRIAVAKSIWGFLDYMDEEKEDKNVLNLPRRGRNLTSDDWMGSLAPELDCRSVFFDFFGAFLVAFFLPVEKQTIKHLPWERLSSVQTCSRCRPSSNAPQRRESQA